MNQQRPLVPDIAVPVGSHGEMDYMPTMPPLPAPRKKKPGPKRDSRPAQSEKLERNRQAQRTHRERKEQYAKDLELEVLRLKELFVNASRERDAAFQARDAAFQARDEAFRERDHLREANHALHEENQRMRDIIQASSSSSGTDSGYDAISVSCDATRSSSFSAPLDSFPGMTAPASASHSSTSNATSTIVRHESIWETSESRGFAVDDALQEQSVIKLEPMDKSMSRKDSTILPASLADSLPAVTIDYDELGLDFVLTLERPCMGHMHYLHIRAHNYQSSADGEMAGQPMEVPDDGENQHISGHGLMATAPPYSHIMETPGSRYPIQYPPNLKREDLIKLLDLSSQLVTNEQELPPVKAWLKIMRDGRLGLLSVDDLNLLKQTLLNKVHCYRFGAVIDNNDIEEALEYVMEARNFGTAIAPPPSACMAPVTSESTSQEQQQHSSPQYLVPNQATNGFLPEHSMQPDQAQVPPGTAF